MKAIHRERLHQVCRVLRDLPPKKGFSLSYWTSDDISGSCGTVACAIGWATYDSWFQRQGFHLLPETFAHAPRPSYKGATNWNAVTKFFGIDKATALDLFSETEYPLGVAKVDVIKRIETFARPQQSPLLLLVFRPTEEARYG